jgi:hypothetical protein
MLKRWLIHRATRRLQGAGFSIVRPRTIQLLRSELYALQTYTDRSGALLAQNDRRLNAYYVVNGFCRHALTTLAEGEMIS